MPDTILDVAYRVITVSDRLFQIVRLSEPHLYGNPSTPTMPKHRRFGLFRFRSPLLTESLLFSFPVGNEMFQFPTFASRIPGMTGCPAGLPHSEICGSRDICSSPQLFAAYHVLLRLREPRHPPYALFYFLRLRPSLFDERRVSYSMALAFSFCLRFHHVKDLFFVENNGFEPLTPCLQSRCSSQLS